MCLQLRERRDGGGLQSEAALNHSYWEKLLSSGGQGGDKALDRPWVSMLAAGGQSPMSPSDYPKGKNTISDALTHRLPEGTNFEAALCGALPGSGG